MELELELGFHPPSGPETERPDGFVRVVTRWKADTERLGLALGTRNGLLSLRDVGRRGLEVREPKLRSLVEERALLRPELMTLFGRILTTP